MARPARRSGNLPAEATSFIGRRRELAEIRKKLTEARLVTLAGPGGVGKTRLAIRAASDLRRGFRDGGWLAEFAELREPDLVGNAVMSALGLRDQTGTEPMALLLSYLRDKELLLVVDNCEHLLDAAAQLVAGVMKAAPDVRIIATSREPLSAPGEYVVPVPPLELPAAEPGEDLDRLRRTEAVMLFMERAAAASGTFELTAANQAAVVDLCRRLADRFSLLTGTSRAALPRHQTLRTTIEWSHDLLPDGERAVLRRACAFAGRFTLEDVESVCVSVDLPATQALGLVSSLVDKSLMMKEDVKGLACYRLHETMREFAALKLAEAGEEEAVELRCAEYYRSRCARSAMENRYRLLEWLDWADLEIDNVRAVLQRCLERADATRGIELAASLGWYWITRALTEGIRWLDALLASGTGDPEAHGWAYFMRGFLSLLKADPAGAGPALQAAVATARVTEQRDLLSEALSIASIAENLAGDHESAGRLLAEADVTAAGLGPAYPSGTLAVLQARAFNGFFMADLGAVRSAAAEGARLARKTGDLYGLEMMLLNLGCAALLAGDLEGPKPLLSEAVRIAHQIDDRVAQYYLLDAIGCHAALTRQARRAAQLLGAAETVRTEIGANVMPFLTPSLAQANELAVAALGATRFEAEFESGKRMDLDAAVSLALGKPTPSGDGADAARAAPAEAGAGVLAKREADVARLVADGLTNKQIGARLFISERTVDSHIRSILNKLGASSRAQIATWVTSPDR